VHLKGANSLGISGLSFKDALVDTGRATSLLLCTNGLRKWSSDHVGPPLRAVKFVSDYGGATIGQDP